MKRRVWFVFGDNVLYMSDFNKTLEINFIELYGLNIGETALFPVNKIRGTSHFGSIFSKILTDFMPRKIILLFSLVLGFSSGVWSQLPLIPRPQSVQMAEGSVTLTTGTSVYAGDQLKPAAAFLQKALRELPSMQVSPGSKAGPAIRLGVDPREKKESYVLTVGPDGIQVTGGDEAGVFYGIQSLLQLAGQSFVIPACRISDSPRFGYRGLHLDVGRNMFPLSFLKKYIDLMALYKLNTFHWHLTEDQGWRIEIRKYPELQRVAAYRDETIMGHKKDSPHRFDGEPYGGFYTQEEVKELVQYASERHITIIPEIEMPGHATAALAAYPHLGWGRLPYCYLLGRF